MPILLAAVLSLGSPQEKSPAKTVEERLKELEDRLDGLEKRNKALAEENQALEKRLADAKAAKEAWAKQNAVGWVKRYSGPAGFTEKQSAEFEELWLGWVKSDFEKPADAAVWSTREETIRSKLAADQVPKLARAVRDEQEKSAKMSAAAWVQAAKIAPEHAPAFEKAVLAKVPFSENTILLQAHPERQAGWPKVTAAVEESLPALAGVLGDDELVRLRDTLSKWKPRR